LRILHLEDDLNDTEIVQERLEAGAVPIEIICRVETEQEFVRALAQPFDVILADWLLPAFDGLTALAIAREKAPNVPFIMVSGKMGEEAAIESLKAGATDYVLKSQLVRLPPAVTRAIQQAEERAQRLRAEARLRESQHLLEAIVENSSAIITLKDLQGRYLLANRRFAYVLGVPQEAIVGKTDRDLFPAEFAESARGLDQCALEARRSVETEEVIPGEQGPRTYLSIRCPISNSSGEAFAVCGMSNDITSRKHGELEREQLLVREQVARAEAERAGRMKDEFLGLVSHELRNPLGPICSSIRVLDRVSADSPQAAIARQIIRRQSEHLARIVDDLLEVTRISRGSIELRRARVDLRDIVLRSCQDHRELFAQRAVELRSCLPASPVWIDADDTRISQVLGNLLQNAAKFTPGGGVVTVEAEAMGDMAELRVRDTGVGIRAEELEHLFEPFVQGYQGAARAQGGLGLGLALSKELVELHAGSLLVRSDGPGRGSEFCARLPLAAAPGTSAADPAPAPASAPAAAGGPGGRVVLIIEDSEDARQSLSLALGLMGYCVRVAGDGRTGIEEARELRPAVVLCDIGLPDMDGYEIARRLRLDEDLRSTRLIALSGYTRPEDRARARDAGFDAHIAKPPDLDALVGMLAG
jgi:PAS domain S-box-containing protein